jgi:hypothetical protein
MRATAAGTPLFLKNTPAMTQPLSYTAYHLLPWTGARTPDGLVFAQYGRKAKSRSKANLETQVRKRRNGY